MNKEQLKISIEKGKSDELLMANIIPDDIETIQYVFKNTITFENMKTLDEVNIELHKLRKSFGPYKLESYHTWIGDSLDLTYRFENHKDILFKFSISDVSNALEILSQGNCKLVDAPVRETKRIVCER